MYISISWPWTGHAKNWPTNATPAMTFIASCCCQQDDPPIYAISISKWVECCYSFCGLTLAPWWIYNSLHSFHLFYIVSRPSTTDYCRLDSQKTAELAKEPTQYMSAKGVFCHHLIRPIVPFANKISKMRKVVVWRRNVTLQQQTRDHLLPFVFPTRLAISR